MQEDHELRNVASVRLRVRSFAVGCALALLSFAAGAADAAGAVVPKPFVATFAVTFRGIGGGTLRMELRADTHPNRYVFETRANPSTLARLFVSRDAVERSVIEVTPAGLRPLSWFADDAKSGSKGDGNVHFDWAAQQVSGEAEGKPVALATEPNLQDRMSMQVAVMAQLMQGKEPGSIAMLNDDNIRHYSYTRTGAAAMDTPLGRLDTVIYESTRPNSNRVSRMWHAPSLDYLPVRLEQVRKGKIETVMTLVSVER